MKPTIPILFLMLFSFDLVFGQDLEKAQSFSLAEAQAYALANNDSIKLAKIDEGTANLQVKEKSMRNKIGIVGFITKS